MDDQLKNKLTNEGVSKIRYYHYSTPLINNIFTICLLLDDQKKPLARGVSVCSLLDTYKKKEGKNRSLGRAVKALLSKKASEPIILRDDRWEGEYVIRSVKVKNEEMRRFYADEIVPSLPPDCFIRSFSIKRGSDIVQKHQIYIPRIYPVELAAQCFDYKSEYQPELWDFEEAWIQNCK